MVLQRVYTPDQTRCDSMSEMGYYDSYTEKPQEAAALGWENCQHGTPTQA
jgi:hypothetical protein